jgi:hypothetical protein
MLRCVFVEYSDGWVHLIYVEIRTIQCVKIWY